MKKQSFITILLSVLMSMVGTRAFAHDIAVANADSKTIYYVWTNNGTELSVSYQGSKYNSYSNEYSGTIVIPKSVEYGGNTYNVTSIGDYAFINCSGLTSVTIPNSVTSIGDYTFYGCSGLTSVTIPNSVTSIGGSAFYGCSGLTSVTIPNSVTSIGGSAFYGCSGLTSVTIPNSVTSIGSSAFERCSGLTSVTIPNSVTSISSSAFASCSGLTSVTIPNSVTSIGYGAFDGCTGLTSVTIPNSVTSIGYYAFSGCSGLTSVTIGNSVTSIGDHTFYGCSGLTTVTIGNSVTSIDSYAFYNCSSLTSVTIPNSVESIGSYAFQNCRGLTSVTIPNSVTSIDGSAFYGCIGLTSVTIPNSVTSIGSSAFRGCIGLTSVTIPNSVTSIGGYAFEGCSGLVTIVSEIEDPFEINENTFDSNIYAKATLAVPAGKKAAYQSTNGWNMFTNIIEDVRVGYVFESDGIYYKVDENNTVSVTSGPTKYSGDVNIPNQVTFSEKTYSVTRLGIAFRNCSDLSSISIPNSVETIGSQAFEGCSSLMSITIPNSIKRIEEDAFNGCVVLNAVHISDLEAWLNINIEEESHNSVPGSSSPLYYAKRLFLNGTEIRNLEIPNTITSIKSFTFDNWSRLNSVTIPNSVTSIGFMSFKGCSGLTSVTIPNSVTSIGNYAFYNCSGLKSVTIPNSVTSIGSGTFNSCSGLTSVTIPNSVTSIGGYAFKGCRGLGTIVSEIEDLFEINENTFDTNIYAKATLVVPAGKKAAYQATNGWNKFTNIVEVGGVGYVFESDGIYYKVDENNTVSVTSGPTKYSGDVNIPKQASFNGKTYSVTSIGKSAFLGCSGLTSINISEGVTSIDRYAFERCSSLTSITIPSSVTYIGEEAFYLCKNLNIVNVLDIEKWCGITFGAVANPLVYAHHLYINGEEIKELVIPNEVTIINDYVFEGCSALTSVTINNSVTSIGKYAFKGCSGLTSINIPEGVTSIGNYAFSNCSDLISVNIPNSFTSFGVDVFSGTAWYNSQPNGLVYAGKVAYKYKGTMPEDCHITIKDGTLGIAGSAFYGFSGLTSVTIPNSVTSIGSSAFSGCSGLRNIVSEIEDPFEIGTGVFYSSNYSTATLIVPAGKKAAYQAINGWNNFTNIVEAGEGGVVGQIIKIDGLNYSIDGNYTVSVATNMWKDGEIIIPSQVIYNGKTYSVTSIASDAFMNCLGLTSIIIPASITSIGSMAFWDVASNFSVYISDLEAWCKIFKYNSFSHYRLFLNGNEIKDLVIPNSITSISRDAFSRCIGLTSVTIPNSVTSIGYYAFYECSGLTSAIIGSGVTSIGDAFSSCNNLQEMILSQTAYENGIPSSVTKFTTYSKNPMRVEVGTKGATAAVLNISPIEGNGAVTVTMQGLKPEQMIPWKLNDENYGIISEKTEATLNMEVQPAQPTSKTKARLSATVNELDDDTHFGFEWLRYDAPDNMTPNKVSSPLYEGQIVGSLSNLNPDVYYKLLLSAKP